MKISMIPSDVTTELDGVPCRLWHGTTDKGTPCKVFVHRIAVEESRNEEFEAELLEQASPLLTDSLAAALDADERSDVE